MPSRSAWQAYERARRSKAGWKARELRALYLAWGFTLRQAGPHDFAEHPALLGKGTTVTRASGEIPKGYVQEAVKLIAELISSQALEPPTKKQKPT